MSATGPSRPERVCGRYWCLTVWITVHIRTDWIEPLECLSPDYRHLGPVVLSHSQTDPQLMHKLQPLYGQWLDVSCSWVSWDVGCIQDTQGHFVF